MSEPAVLPSVTTADMVNELHHRAAASAEYAVEAACEIGRLLIARKDELEHGQFMPWIEAECDFSHSTAKVYMNAARQKDSGLAFSSLRQLYGPPRDERPKPDRADHEPEKHEGAALSIALEELYLPSANPEALIAKYGTEFMSGKAEENLQYLVDLFDMIDAMRDAPGA